MLGFVIIKASQSKEEPMKFTKRFTAIFLTALICLSVPLAGCSELINNYFETETTSAQSVTETSTTAQKTEKTTKAQKSKTQSSKVKDEPTTAKQKSSDTKAAYTMADIKKLKNTGNFAKNTLEHIFDGTINSKGKATGYHYSMVSDSKGSIIDGTRSKEDAHGVFTAKVQVDGVKKNGFSSFYPESWSPQQIVDAINTAYEGAISSPDNPQGSIWVGYCDDLEINMYLNDNKKITTAFPIYEGD